MELIYQDRSIVVCVKPAGVLSTDEPGGVPELVRAALGEPHGCVRTVHRLDRVVSGLMVLARTPESASQLSCQIREQGFQKEYLAVVHGCPQEPEGIFRDLLRRDKAERKTYVTELPGKGVQEAVLTYRLLEQVGSAPTRSGLSSPPGAFPWWGTGNTACWTTAVPSPFGPTAWPSAILPQERP